MLVLVAQAGLAGNVANMVILAIIVAAVIAIGAVAIKAAGIQIPAWAVNIFWIVVICLFAILAIRIVMGWA